MKTIDKVNENLKEAMRAKDETSLNVLRAIKTACVNELVGKGGTPQSEITDEVAQTIINRLAKQRKDAIEQFEAGGRQDLADKEKAELKILEQYLPEMMSEEEVKTIVSKKAEELGVSDKSQMGQLMGAVMAELKGRADGNVVKKEVELLLK